MVLATDMSSHFQQIKAMKNILNHSDNFNADKSKILSLVIHISDISHPAKEWELHSTWTQLLMEEFFRQGDREKELNLECSPLCDRETTLVAESQLGFIEFIVSPSLEVCGDVLDRVHYQMAEANARPVLPASAKAASMVAASSVATSCIESVGGARKALTAGPQQQQQQQVQSAVAAIEAATTTTEPTLRLSGSAQSADRWPGGHSSELHHSHQGPKRQQALKLLGSSSSSSVGSVSSSSPQSSLAASLVSSETLTSNLRKIIVSSSATIGRKLNISGNASSSSQPQPQPTLVQQQLQQQQQQQQLQQQQQQQQQQEQAISDFETRQANYKHPVIQCASINTNESSGSSQRPKSTGSLATSGQQQTAASRQGSCGVGDSSIDNLGGGGGCGNLSVATQDSAATAAASLTNRSPSNQLSRLAQPGEVSKRPTSAALNACSQTSRSAPSLQPQKIQRPWIACLERNKRMWQERAVTDAQARELKERLKLQHQIDSPESQQQQQQRQ